MKSFCRAGLLALALCSGLMAPASAETPIYSITTTLDGTTRAITAAEINAIGTTEITTKVITLGDERRKVKGVLARDLLKFAGATGRNLKITALDGYIMDVPGADLERYDVVIATEIDGKKLTVRDKGPAWLIYPVSDHKELDDTVYESRSVWQIKTIEIN